MLLTLDEIQVLIETLDAIKHEREHKVLRAKLMDERHRLVRLKEACDEVITESSQGRWVPQDALRTLVNHARKDHLW